MQQDSAVDGTVPNRRIDIAFASLLGEEAPKPIQVKSSDGKSHQKHYHPDVKVVDAKTIKKLVLKNLEGASKLRDFGSLYQLFVNAPPSVVAPRMKTLEDVLSHELLPQLTD
jgi:hypothetical protein